MAFGNSNDTEIKVTLDTADADRKAKDLKNTLEGIANQGRQGFTALDGAGRGIASGFSAAATAARLASVGVAGVTAAFYALDKIAQRGDAVSDVADAFDQAAKKAGVLSSTLINQLSLATKHTVSSFDLMRVANKAFTLGIDPHAFGALAAAAQKFADKNAIDVVQAFETLTQAINTGRRTMLLQFGTLRDGNLILDQFTQEQANAATASRGLGDALTGLTTTLVNGFDAFAAWVNSSSVLAAGVDNLTFKFRVLGKEIEALASGTFPDLGQIYLDLAKEGMASVSKEGEKAAKVILKTGNAAEEAGKKLADAQKQIKATLQSSDFSLADAFDLETVGLSFGRSLRDEMEKALESTTVEFQRLDLMKGLREELLSGLTDPDDIAQAVERFNKELSRALQNEQSLANRQLGPGNASGLAEFNQQMWAAGNKGILEKANDDLAKSLGFTTDGFKDASAKLNDFVGTVDTAIGGLTNFANASISLIQGIQSGQLGKRGSFGQLGSTVGTVGGAIAGGVIGAAAGPLGILVGAGIGSSLGGAAGGLLGGVAELFGGKDSAGTKGRKAADKFFADIFDADRLSVVINGELKRIKDLVFSGDTPFGGSSDFKSGSFDDFLTTLPATAQQAFQGVGAAFEQLLGVTDEIGGQIGAVLANNIGGNLQNLQLLVQATGASFQELGDAIIESFLNGQLSIQQAYESLASLQELFTVGIPGAIGAVTEAFNNFQAAFADGSGSRALIDSIRDVGAEAQELHLNTLPQLANYMVEVLHLDAIAVANFFEAAKASGIQSITELVNASTAQLITVASNVDKITKGEAPTSGAITDPTAGITPPGNFTSGGVKSFGGGGGGGSSGASAAANKAKAAQDQLKNQILSLVQASEAYKTINEQLTSGLLNQVAAGKKLKDLYKEIADNETKLTKVQEQFEKELEKGGKANASRLAHLAELIEKLKKKLEDFNEVPQHLDLSAFSSNLDILTAAGQQLGATYEDAAKSITAAFEAGKISASEAAQKLKETKDAFQGGLPGVTGDTAGAFRQLLSSGTKGGFVSERALGNIFTEGKERFLQGLNPARAQEFVTLNSAFEKARGEFESANAGGRQAGESSGDFTSRITFLRDTLAGAKKELDDFNAVVPQFGLKDLRGQLSEAFDQDTVDKFFKAISDNGINTFDEFTNATKDVKVAILGELQDIGLPFQETSDQVKKLLDDVAKLTSGEKVVKVKFDVSVGGDPSAQTLMDILFGDGSDLGSTVTGPGKASGSASAKQQARLDFLKRKGRKNEYNDLAKRIGVPTL